MSCTSLKSVDTDDALRQELTKVLKHMRDIASISDVLLAQFDCTYKNHLLSFDMNDFVNNSSRISSGHIYSSLLLTLKDISAYCTDCSDRAVGNIDSPNWENLATTFWNLFIEKMFNDFKLRISQQPGRDKHQAQLPSRSTHSTSGKQTPRPKTKDEREVLKSELLALRSTRSGLVFTGKNSCKKIGCKNCQLIFDNTPLVPCKRVHPNVVACTSAGWYPHLNSSQWHRLSRAHDGENFFFNPPVPSEGQRFNPLQKRTSKADSSVVQKKIVLETPKKTVNLLDPSTSTEWYDTVIASEPESPSRKRVNPESDSEIEESGLFVPKRRPLPDM